MSSKEIGAVFVLSATLVSFVSFFFSCYYLVKTSLNRRPGVPFSDRGQSPYNIVFRPHQLTEAGLKSRRKFIFWITLLVCTLLSTIVLPAIATY